MSKKIKIGINGFGRIGTVVLRAILLENYDVEVAAINTKGDFGIESVAYNSNTIRSMEESPTMSILVKQN